jgi:hypothetical protein
MVLPDISGIIIFYRKTKCLKIKKINWITKHARVLEIAMVRVCQNNLERELWCENMYRSDEKER